MQVFDSNGPDVRIRGTAHQVCEKYLTLAKDAAAAGDRIVAENYLQHAEHYQRIINSFEEDVRQQSNGFQRPGQNTAGEADGNRSRDDLALPASILGGNANAKSAEAAAERTGELTTA
jgi:phospholipase/lecithinase/hemolysin